MDTRRVLIPKLILAPVGLEGTADLQMRDDGRFGSALAQEFVAFRIGTTHLG